MISDFGFAVGLWPTRRTVACGRFMASSFRRGLIRLSSRRWVRISDFHTFPGDPFGQAVRIPNSEFRIPNSIGVLVR